MIKHIAQRSLKWGGLNEEYNALTKKILLNNLKYFTSNTAIKKYKG